MKLINRDRRQAVLPRGLAEAADRLEAAIDGYAAVYGKDHSADIDITAARKVYADLAVVSGHLAELRRGGGVR